MFNIFGSFDLYKENSTTTMHSVYKNKFQLPFEHISDPVGLTLVLQRTWYHTITISLLYYAIIKTIERAMRDWKPFDLRKQMFWWNSGLALFSVCGLIRFTEEPLHNLLTQGFSYSICHTPNPSGVSAFWALLFFLSKFAEFGDTLFIVLRKRRLIFLHYYHHAAVLIFSAHVGAEHAAPASLFVPMNLFAHSLMYSYFALTSLGYKIPRPIAMLITTVQTVQMLCGVAITAFAFKVKAIDGKRCQQSMANLYLAIFLYTTFAVLFIKFFHGAYLKKRTGDKKEDSRDSQKQKKKNE